MKPYKLVVLILALTLGVAACATPAATPSSGVAAPSGPTPTSFAAAYLNTDYADAASLRNQLAFGTLELEGAPNAIAAEQAKALLPLWQAIIALSGTGAAEAELTAVQNQIVEAMQLTQLQAIAALKITNAQLSAFYAERGVILPTPVPGATKAPGSGQDTSQADKEATRTAAQALGTPVGTSSGAGQAAKTLLFDEVVKLLTARAGK